uniref:Uncharacterized protein n=1 Tax=Anguilla anguilla TaxID=7936 RepID=A0A0E9Q213_ANGAN
MVLIDQWKTWFTFVTGTVSHWFCDISLNTAIFLITI